MKAPLFPVAEYWWLYVAFTALVLRLLALDLGVFHRKARAPSFREAALWMCVWVGLALVFCIGLYQYIGWNFGDVRAKQAALEFLNGYVVEESLSLDNMFVFVLIFAYFQIPAQFHHGVLFYGILGALLSRGIFIALGSTLLQFSCYLVRHLSCLHRFEDDGRTRAPGRSREGLGDAPASQNRTRDA